MAKRRTKRTVKKPFGDHTSSTSNCTNVQEPEVQIKTCQFFDQEVERRIAATQAIRDAEVQHLLTGLRLLRSNFNSEQLQTPVLQFFKENMPNVTTKISEKDGLFEVSWKDKDSHLSISQTDERNLHESLLEQIYKAYPGFPAGMAPVGGSQFTSHTGNADHLGGASNFQMPDFVMEQPSGSQMLGLQEAFHTPGANSQRLSSVGMTPKTVRLPKNGEMLLSVRGSPLGVYKEDNMEAIDESEEGLAG